MLTDRADPAQKIETVEDVTILSRDSLQNSDMIAR